MSLIGVGQINMSIQSKPDNWRRLNLNVCYERQPIAARGSKLDLVDWVLFDPIAIISAPFASLQLRSAHTKGRSSHL